MWLGAKMCMKGVVFVYRSPHVPVSRCWTTFSFFNRPREYRLGCCYAVLELESCTQQQVPAQICTRYQLDSTWCRYLVRIYEFNWLSNNFLFAVEQCVFRAPTNCCEFNDKITTNCCEFNDKIIDAQICKVGKSPFARDLCCDDGSSRSW